MMGPEHHTSDEDTDAVIIGRDDVSDYNPAQLLPESPEVIEKIRAWLQPTAYDIAGGEYRRHLASHVAGTGDWLTSSDQYQKWLNGEEYGLLWIKGIPGSGKSVMAASLIDEIAKSNPGTPVLYFFFRQIIDANHEPRALLRDWTDQILKYSPPLQKQLKSHVEAHRSFDSLSVEGLWNQLIMAFSSLPGKVFCVADALDEMDQGNDEFLETLEVLGRWRPKTTKVLITSRPVASVEVPLRKAACLHIRLQEALVDMDISTYVHFALSKSDIPKEDWQVIADAVPGRANGLFLYAKLAMDAFLEPNSDIKDVLLKLPTDLNALYTNLLNEHAKRSGVPGDIQHLILQSITHATRPLRLLELAEMIRISFYNDTDRDIKATKGLIRAACGPLLEILPDETVSVIHHSFTEYLKGVTRPDEDQQSGYPVLMMGPTHAELALQCILYLRSGCLGDVALHTDEHMDELSHRFNSIHQNLKRKIEDEEISMRLKFPFFEYAASNWYQHIARSEAAGQDQTEINAKLKELFGFSKNKTAWLQMRWPDNSLGARSVTQLHIAAKSGLVSYVKELLGSFDINVPDIYDRTPLWWAAREGHAEIVSILIENGADPDLPDNLAGLKPLHEAAIYDHPEVVSALLKADVNPLTEKTIEDPWGRCGNIPSSVGETPLLYACNGHLEALEAFVPFIKDDMDIMNRAIAWTASSGSSNCVNMLLQQPDVDVNATIDGQTLLYRACEKVDDAMVAMLLKAGADVNIKCNPGTDVSWRWDNEPAGLNCLFALCHQHESEHYYDKLQIIFPQLLEAGVDIHYRTPSGETALHTASQCPVLIKLLLEAGLDANATDNTGATPLHLIRSALPTVLPSMALLVELGNADINAAKKDGQTPIQTIISTLDEATIMRFLEYEPSCRNMDNRGNTPLHTLLQHSSPSREVVRTMLALGADPNARNNDGLTPVLVWIQANEDRIAIMDTLLEAGADINTVDKEGNNLIFRCLSSLNVFYNAEDCNGDIKYLINRGISPFQRNFRGETALQYAIRHRHAYEPRGNDVATSISRLDFLIGLNIEVNAIDYNGNTLLHTVAMQKDNHDSYHGPRLVKLWGKLVALGLDLEQKNNAGRTPLHILCATHTRSLRLEPGKVMSIDFVLSRVKNPNVPDNDGITPLHIAVTCGGVYSKKLIDAGANPLVYTHEKLTPLHLAARSRDSNNVGLLLDALRKQQNFLLDINNSTQPKSCEGSSNRAEVMGVNAKASVDASSDTDTPLYYACRSGRPETVALLLEAGANVKGKDVFRGCLDFEKECRLWKVPQQQQEGLAFVPQNPVKLANTYRNAGYDRWSSGVPDISPSDTARLEEIIDMLVEHGAGISGLLNIPGRRRDGFINEAVKKQRDYTAACLRRAHSSLALDTEEGLDELTNLSKATYYHEQKATVQAVASSKLIQHGEQDQVVPLSFVTRFLIRKEYHVLEELVRLGVTFLPKSLEDFTYDAGGYCSLWHLIQLGFTSLVDKIASIETEAKLGKGEWHAFGDESRPGLYFANRNGPPSSFKPFIIGAIQRELPNMDMVRLLVEKYVVDVNEPDGEMEPALFYVARGNYWWQVHQALPYLLDARADINIRNTKGQTPLHMALRADDNWPGPFNWDAARILIERGADVDAIDANGQSCLACAQHNVDMINLLIKHGATVTVDSIFGAIDSGNANVLRALLSGGMDPNARRGKPVEPDERKLREDQVEPHEEFPLHYAAMQLSMSARFTDDFYQVLATKTQIVEILLQHGADPFAKYLKRDRGSLEELDLSETQNTTIEVPEGYRECTLLHEVLSSGIIVDVFLKLSNLDVNRRDATGRTLLHMICQNSGGPDGGGPDHVVGSYLQDSELTPEESVSAFQQLLSLGADLEATDNFGRNVLHHMLSGYKYKHFNTYKESYTYVLDKAPKLFNQADGHGETPFHYAARRATSRHTTEELQMLLAAGADYTVINKKGETLLHILGPSVYSEAPRTFFQKLVDKGIDINARNNRGETALFSFYSNPKFHAGWRYFLKVEKESTALTMPMLKESGGNFYLRDKKGRGLLHAAAGGDVERFKELMDIGLDPLLEDDAQQTAIDVVVACGNKEILELFEKKN